jgi:hypothetical protein
MAAERAEENRAPKEERVIPESNEDGNEDEELAREKCA